MRLDPIYARGRCDRRCSRYAPACHVCGAQRCTQDPRLVSPRNEAAGSEVTAIRSSTRLARAARRHLPVRPPLASRARRPLEGPRRKGDRAGPHTDRLIGRRESRASCPLYGVRQHSTQSSDRVAHLPNTQPTRPDRLPASEDGRPAHSSASAESVMNHLVNRRLSKRQQMRWSIKGAHCLLQTRVELLDGRLEECFAVRYPHFRSPDIRSDS